MIYLAIQPHPILLEARANSNGSSRREMIRIKRDADAVVDGKDQGLVALSPVLDHRNVGRSPRRSHQNPALRLPRHLQPEQSPPVQKP